MKRKELLGKARKDSLRVYKRIREDDEWTFNSMVENLFISEEQEFMKRRMLGNVSLHRDKEVKRNAETIAVYQRVLNCAIQEREAIEDECLEIDKMYNWVAKMLKSLGDKRKEIESSLKYARAEEKEARERLDKQIQISNELQKTVLVHNTASVRDLQRFQYRKIIMTKEDEQFAKVINADEIFDQSINFIEIFPYQMMLVDGLTGTEKSALAFANMVIYYYLEGIDFDLCYSSHLIDELLELNGFFNK